MKTKLYKPISTIDNEYAIVDFKDSSGRLSNFFVYNDGDEKILNYAKPVAIAQHGFTQENIRESDFLQATMSIPIFSDRFKQKLEKILSEEVTFYECSIIVGEKEHQFYIGKLLKLVDLIDKEKSQYRKLSDGTPILSRLAYREDFNESFYIARDTENPHIYEATEAFKKLTEKENLKVNFYERFNKHSNQ